MPANLRLPEPGEAIAVVRDIRSIGGDLFAVSIRLRSGRVETIITSRRLATTAYVAMAAEVVAALGELGRL